MAYKLKNYKYNDKLTTEENLLLDRLFKFKLSHMAEELERQLVNPNSDLEDFHTRITKLINYEWEQRQQAKFNKLMKKATLKYPHADFDEAIYESDRMLDTKTIELLQKCTWIDEPKNLLITGSAGAGKTHIANALCIAALQQHRSVKYIRASSLMNESEKARLNNSAYDYINTMAEYDLLVIDDFGLMELDMDKCRDLFEIIETRDCRKATMIVSQLPVIKWWDLFIDNTYADACLSRMTSKAYRLECNGRDMRKTM
ncbi:MAG: ATP-binding protein [Lachnospiraceae bacterium]|nr:ATP-binding protein [Lachnospiraceae bacterium]